MGSVRFTSALIVLAFLFLLLDEANRVAAMKKLLFGSSKSSKNKGKEAESTTNQEEHYPHASSYDEVYDDGEEKYEAPPPRVVESDFQYNEEAQRFADEFTSQDHRLPQIEANNEYWQNKEKYEATYNAAQAIKEEEEANEKSGKKKKKSSGGSSSWWNKKKGSGR